MEEETDAEAAPAVEAETKGIFKEVKIVYTQVVSGELLPTACTYASFSASQHWWEVEQLVELA